MKKKTESLQRAYEFGNETKRRASFKPSISVDGRVDAEKIQDPLFKIFWLHRFYILS